MLKPQLVLNKIEEAKERGLEKLHLNNMQLTQLPESIGQLVKLTHLNLSSNQLIQLHEDMGQLIKLTYLDLNYNQLNSLPEGISHLNNLAELNSHHNRITQLPKGIGQLVNLTHLDLSYNELGNLPECIGQLTNLKTLDLSHNQLASLPENFDQLNKLEFLDLSHNQFTQLPKNFGQLTNLKSLNLSNNRLTQLPKNFDQLNKLDFLSLNHNQFSQLPESFSQLTNLTSLFLSDNQLTHLHRNIYKLHNIRNLCIDNNRLLSLSPEITQLKQLNTLRLSGNPLTTPPLEVLDFNASGYVNLRKIYAYFRQQEESGTDYIYEAKLLIIGEGGAGKTTLARKLVDPNCDLPHEDDTTRGIEVGRWQFNYKSKELDAEVKFRVNIWDFGGQEIYHATHQFFLTKRAVYVLVDDTREQKTDFYYWLNVVELFSNNSPLLIVQNEKQDRPCAIPERELRRQFTDFKELRQTNLATQRGLSELQTKLQYYLTQLPHVGSALPKSWVQVRQVMEEDSRNYISLQEYLTLCDQYGFKQLEDKLQLSDYLHDLGVCLHFQADPLLKQTVILKPKWGTDAVYKVLDNITIQQNLGRFTWVQAAEIWNLPEYAYKQAELLQLMLNFKLCYPLRDVPHTYISPQLLGEAHGNYSWDDHDNLQLRYKYEFMPKGLLARFIVETHAWIENQAWVWRSGVVLAKDKSRAEVIEYYGKREIQVRVSGMHKKELLTIVAHELDKIHASYPRLRYDKLIPCNCQLCHQTNQPYFFEFEKLRRRCENQIYITECEISYQKVDILALLDDIGNTSTFVKPSKKAVSQQNKQILIQALAECLQLQDMEVRDLIVNQLSFGTHIKRNQATKIHLSHIINVCLANSNGMEEFLEVLEFYEEGSLAIQAVRKIWENWQL